jgi:hypothetical protein
MASKSDAAAEAAKEQAEAERARAIQAESKLADALKLAERYCLFVARTC